MAAIDSGFGHGAAATIVLLGELVLGGNLLVLVLIDLPAGGLGLGHGEHSSNCNGLDERKLGWYDNGTYAFHDQIRVKFKFYF